MERYKIEINTFWFMYKSFFFFVKMTYRQYMSQENI